MSGTGLCCARSGVIVAIHQPNFLPWIGYFYKMLKADRFILLDDVQFIRRGYTGRVKIKSQTGDQWLSVPVLKKGRYDQRVADVELDPGANWQKTLTRTVQSAYGRSPHFKTFFPGFEAIVQKPYTKLVDLNIDLLAWLANAFAIDRPFVRSSELNGVTGRATDRLVSVCKAVEAKRYLSGFGGQRYQEQEVFQRHGIELAVYDFKHPRYPQLWGDFVPGLSSIDLLFNCGPASAEILKEL